MRPRGARGGAAGRRGGGVRAGERRNLEPELPGWRRAGLGDVTALESEECRAAGAPCAGPGAVAHFWSGGLGNCLKPFLRLKRVLGVVVTEDVPDCFSVPHLIQKSGALREENWELKSKTYCAHHVQICGDLTSLSICQPPEQ